MAPPIRTKCKPKGGIAAATKPNNSVTVNPAAANDTAVATCGVAKHSRLGHSTPANATTNNTTEPNPLAAVAVHPATTNDADVPSGDMAMTDGGSDSVEYGNSTISSSPLPPPPAAPEAPSLSLNLLDGKISARNTTVNGEITRVVKNATNTTGSVETIMDTTTNETVPPLILYPLTRSLATTG